MNNGSQGKVILLLFSASAAAVAGVHTHHTHAILCIPSWRSGDFAAAEHSSLWKAKTKPFKKASERRREEEEGKEEKKRKEKKERSLDERKERYNGCSRFVKRPKERETAKRRKR